MYHKPVTQLDDNGGSVVGLFFPFNRQFLVLGLDKFCLPNTVLDNTGLCLLMLITQHSVLPSGVVSKLPMC